MWFMGLTFLVCNRDNKNKWTAGKRCLIHPDWIKETQTEVLVFMPFPFFTLFPTVIGTAIPPPREFPGTISNCLWRQSRVENSYSFSVFQVSPTQSIQTQGTLSCCSGRGGASKNPNNCSGSQCLKLLHVFRVKKTRVVLGAKCKLHFILLFLPVEPFPQTDCYFMSIYSESLVNRHNILIQFRYAEATSRGIKPFLLKKWTEI